MEVTRGGSSAEFLMCPPTYFNVSYVINPWMHGNGGTVDTRAADRQWTEFVHVLSDTLGARVHLVSPAPGSPDMVFTADAAIVRGRRCVVARFRYDERRGAETHYRRWFVDNGFTLGVAPDDIPFEGSGDALFDEGDPGLLWAGHGIRSDGRAHDYLSEFFGVRVLSLTLVDAKFFHLDTCFCPLQDGLLIWYPPAFDLASRELIMSTVIESKRFALGQEAAEAFVCNAVGVGTSVIANAAPEPVVAGLRSWLADWGRALHTVQLSQFLKAGGSAKCLTLRVI